MKPNPIIKFEHVDKIYHSGKLKIPVLKNVSFNIPSGEICAIMGPSGSGKTTIMNIIGLLDRASAGEIWLNGKKVTLDMPDTGLARLRAATVGFVFQSFNLLPKMSALSNVMLPTIYSNNKAHATARASKILHRVGLGSRIKHKPSELSGGEKQRVAIARALMNDPQIILADEPTGNLDSASGQEIMDVLCDLQSQGKTVVVITHDEAVAKRCQRIIRLLDGRVLSDSKKGQ